MRATARKISLALAAAAAMAVGTIGGAAFASTYAGNDASTSRTVIETPEYPSNKAGLTYGSAAEAPSPDLEPDLILVETADGVTGYVHKKDLDIANGAAAASPREALDWQKAAPDVRDVPVFELDGVTRIGVFSVGGGTETPPE